MTSDSFDDFGGEPVNKSDTLAPLEPLDADRFRRELAGLIDEERSGVHKPADFREQSAMLCYCLAKVYNRDVLEAIKLWERIGTAIATACEQVDDGDLDRFISICLEHVKASHSKVAADDEVGHVLAEITESEESWRLAFVNYLKSHSYTAIIHGRRMWETSKEDRNESRKGGAA